MLVIFPSVTGLKLQKTELDYQVMTASSFAPTPRQGSAPASKK